MTNKKPYSLQDMLDTADLWHSTYVGSVYGWPELYCLIWRLKEGHGKIGDSFKFRKPPTDKQIAHCLKLLLTRRYKSSLSCDANTTALSEWESLQPILLAEDVICSDCGEHAELYEETGTACCNAASRFSY